LYATWHEFNELKDMMEAGHSAACQDRLNIGADLRRLNEDLLYLVESRRDEGSRGNLERLPVPGVEGKGARSRLLYKPDVAFARHQPTHICQLSHQTLAQLAVLGHHATHRERLLREIMCADGVTWHEAHKVLELIDEENRKLHRVQMLPFMLGVTGSMLLGVLSTLFVFVKPTALWYGRCVANEDLPESVEIDDMTNFQVGTWTWAWMEPMIGTASFVLICCQFIRISCKPLNMKTYMDLVLSYRAHRIAVKFPKYDRSMVRAYSKHVPKFNFIRAVTEMEQGFRGPPSGL
jgi:hypothetical protein